MPDDQRASKPRRRGLWWPYIALLILIAVWSGAWLFLRGQIAGRIDGAAADLRAQGYDVSWASRRISGYPFRFEVEMTAAKLAQPAGWGLAAPNVKAMAAAYRIDHWVFVASDGLTLWRPGKGPVDLKADILRASVANASKAARISVEGRKLTFVDRPGAQPFPFTAAELVEIHLRPKGADQTELLWRLDGAQTRRTGVFTQIAPLAPLSMRVAADLDKRSQFTGEDWAAAVRRWSEAGGAATVNQMVVSVGEISVTAKGGPVTVGHDGRLQGELGLSFQQGAAALGALGAMAAGVPSFGQGAQLPLRFEAGSSTIGPIRIGAAPRVY